MAVRRMGKRRWFGPTFLAVRLIGNGHKISNLMAKHGDDTGAHDMSVSALLTVVRLEIYCLIM